MKIKSVPILRLNAHTLIVVLSSDINDDDVLGFQTDLGDRVSAMQARGVVIDVSALDVVDSFMAHVLNDCARMLRFLGAEVVICGVRPGVAFALVEMRRNLVSVATAFTLERALVCLNALVVAADHPPAPSGGRDA